MDLFVPDDLRNDYIYVIWDMNIKRHKLELHDAYSKIVLADNADDRDLARIEYLRKRHLP